MKKLSMPWIGDPEKGMGSMEPTGDPDRDIQVGEGGSKGYQLLVDHRSLTTDPETGAGSPPYSEGMFFPLKNSEEDMEIAEIDEGLDIFSNAFINLLKTGSNLLYMGPQDGDKLGALASRGYNIVSLQDRVSSNDINLSGFPVEAGSPMFYKSRFKLDGFFSSSSFGDAESAEISLKNIYEQMRPLAYGLIISNDDFDIEAIIKKCNFEVIKKSVGKTSGLIIKKNDLDKIAVIRHYNLDRKELSTFECDVAETHQERTVGLQAYSNLLSKCGLVFKFSRPTDAMFHMGSVGFPIDIAFLDDDNTIVKLYRNIKPGSLEIFGSPNTQTVLELAAGAADTIGAKIGDKLFLSYGEQISERFEKESRVLESIDLDKCIYKESSHADGSFYNLSNFNVYLKNSDKAPISALIKNAKNYGVDKSTVICYDLNFVFDSKEIKLYRRDHSDENHRAARSLYGETFSTDGSFIKSSREILLTDNFYKNIGKKYALNVGEYVRSSVSDKNRDAYLRQIHKDSAGVLNNISFIYKDNLNTKLAAELLGAEIREITGDRNFIIKADFIRVPKEFDEGNYLYALTSRYPNHKVIIKAGSLPKTAGAPVPDHVKESARKAVRYFDRAKESCTTLTENLRKNLSVYQKLIDRPDVVRSSKGEYSESCKRNSKITKGCLLNVREGIKILGSIQDISTTEEIISSIAGSAKSFSDSIKEIFELINVIDSEDFVSSLGSGTAIAVIALEDLKTILDRTREYITKNILGMIILSN